nr:TIGR03986 family CRISPR-associated RAMP protein [Plesiomonas shigelloides]
MTQVHAPYHFVPLSKWVYMPDWAHLVSHDIPFKDGYSGAIDYTLTNGTPLCVGGEKDHNGILRFARDGNNNLTIPGSSLKGMIRNVLEIASFGKFSAVDDNRFSYRDFSKNSDYLNNVIKKNKVISGWLKFDSKNSEWQFRECKHAKVLHKEINANLNIAIKNKSLAEEKYQQLPLNKVYYADISLPRGKQNNCWAENINSGQTEGHFVFTQNRIIGKGKDSDYEFSYFFYHPSSTTKHNLTKEIVCNLFTNHNKEQVDYLKNNANPELGIPVFALIKKDKPTEIHSLGLAKTPRVSYKNSIHQLIKNLNPAHLDNAYFDMAELMLGTLRENSLGLKSRVFFSDAIPTQMHSWNNVLKLAAPTVLSVPKATFLGAYIEQNTAGTYASYDHDNSKLAGWKRYPTRKAYKPHEPSNDNNAVISQFELLPEGHEFQGKIVFHNLKSEELAALLWCLTLENRDDHWHGLGHAKPLGAGAVKIKINLTNSKIKANIDSTFTPIVIEHWVDKFIQHMNEHFAPTGKWEHSPQLAYLMAVTDQDVENFNHFDYLTLDDHRKTKNDKLSLPSLELHGDILNRTENYTEDSASLAFAKGRLSVLFDNTSPFHQQQLQYLEKARLAAERLAIENTELEPYDKIVQFTHWLIKGQEKFSNTDKNKHTKALRENIKQLKDLSLTAEQARSLIENFGKIHFCQKDTSKAIALLEKVQ